MNFIGLVLISTLACAWASLLPDTVEEGWFIPQEIGESVWMTTSQLEAIWTCLPDDIFDVKYYLVTRSNPTTPQLLDINNVTSNGYFRQGLFTVFVVHGWQNSYQSQVNVLLSAAYLTALDCNVISVDWSAARTPYPTAVNNVRIVGQKVGTAIQSLVNQNIPLAIIRAVGHSLGAHAVGIAGKTVQTLMGDSLERIDGLDAAWPCFRENNLAGRLANTDAKFVSAIHTNIGELGISWALGNVDYYVNGGQHQPSCLSGDFKCSHLMAYVYYAVAISRNNFLANKCANETDAIRNTCAQEYAPEGMGTLNYSEPLPSGIYYVPVRGCSPYGLGA